MKKYRLIIDEFYCWGCKTCEVACKQEHEAPTGVKLIDVREVFSKDKDGRPNLLFQPNVCRHCDEPLCVPACPVEAIVQREDGIVILDDGECTGCEACLEACPYDAIDFDKVNGVARKCNLCYQRVDKGLLPPCADNVCLGHCIRFGDPGKVGEMSFGLRAAELRMKD